LISIDNVIILRILIVNHLKILFILLIVFLITVLLRMLQLQDKLVIHQRPKASGVKRPTTSVDAAADRVLLRLGLGGEDVAAVDLSDSHVVEILEPAVAGLGDFEVEHASIDDLLDVDFAVAGFQDLGAVVELADEVEQTRLDLGVDLRWVSEGMW
jgi:hypothetical protein